MFILLCLSVTFGLSVQKTSIDIIEESFTNGKIDYETSLIYKLQFIFDYKALPKEFQSEGIEECGTPILMEVLSNWNSFSLKNKKVVEKYIDVNETTGEIVILSEPVLDLTYSYGHFVIEYTTTGIHSVPIVDIDLTGIPDYVESMAKRFEDYTWKHEIITLGYPSLPTPYKIKIFNVRIEGGDINGYTLAHNARSKTTTSHIAMYNNLDLEIKPANRGGIATDAHELFHAIQFYNYINYARLDRRGNPIDADWKIGVWWMEASATWMSDEVPQYDGINWYQHAYLNPARYNWFDYPEYSLNYDSITVHPYGSSIFCKYLTERKSGSWTPDIIKDIWVQCANPHVKTALDAIDNVLKAKATSLEKEFPKFTVCNFIEKPTVFIDDKYSYADDASGDYPDIKVIKTYNPNPTDNQHYIPETGTWEDSPAEIPGLSAHYIKFKPPALLDKPSNIVLKFKAGNPGSWGHKVILVRQDNKKEVYGKI